MHHATPIGYTHCLVQESWKVRLQCYNCKFHALVRIWRNEGVTDDNRLSTTLDEVSVYPIPAALYLIKNLLQYYIFAYVDAPGYQILKNLNIISTGVLYRIILKRKLSEIQWAAFILLCAGCTTAQLNPSSDRVLQTPFEGWVMAIVMALLSGFAGVYTENFWLYVFGMGFNAIAILIQDFDAVMNKGFFHGYSLITTLMILNHALSGIAVSMVMKYADNILKVYSTSVAMLLTAVFSVFLFGFHLSLAFFLGSTIVSVSVYLHCWEGTKIVMTLRLSQIALSMYRLIFCNIFVSFLFFQLIFLNLPVQSICLDNT
ncbi:CMP-sialic acid transporter 4-like isoform X2 [Camellia sinensis]|uniref:CMP-sialic acid transporter 4-like isoform X2 n=1 Tax=Camellia sinensis TaxID=4442 RepID=UPI0010368AA9|nr:CMP-sialic acid transporter 4-like isoform X2 [Camellia sinensis]